MTQQISHKFSFLNFYLLVSVFHDDKCRSSFYCQLTCPRASTCILHLDRNRVAIPLFSGYLRSHTDPGSSGNILPVWFLSCSKGDSIRKKHLKDLKGCSSPKFLTKPHVGKKTTPVPNGLSPGVKHSSNLGRLN